MAKEWYRGVNGVARKVTTPYRGANGVARKVTKAYRGVSGVARLFYNNSLVLFDGENGINNTEITGDWTILGLFGRKKGSISTNASYIKLYMASASQWGGLNVVTSNSIDVSAFSKFCVEGEFTRTNYGNGFPANFRCGLKSPTSANDWADMNCGSTIYNSDKKSGTFSIVSTLTLSGAQYPIIGISEGQGGSAMDVHLTKIWFE